MPANLFIPLTPKTRRRPLFAGRPRFQVAIFSEDGTERLPEVYRFRNAAQMVATQYNLADEKAVRERGGEWFERRFHRVVNAWPWHVRLRVFLRRKWDEYCRDWHWWMNFTEEGRAAKKEIAEYDAREREGW